MDRTAHESDRPRTKGRTDSGGLLLLHGKDEVDADPATTPVDIRNNRRPRQRVLQES